MEYEMIARENQFKEWLKTRKINNIKDIISNCRRVNHYEGDLDALFRKDRCASLMCSLTYSSTEIKNGKPITCNISFKKGTNKYAVIHNLKDACKKYIDFCDGEPPLLSDDMLIKSTDSDVADSETEKLALIKARIGHSQMRKCIIDARKKCAICSINNEKLLIASHIKPWSKSKNHERLDHRNILLLCSMHDALFDKGFITFGDDGTIEVSPAIKDVHYFTDLHIKKDLQISLDEGQSLYLEYHRIHKFKSQ